MTWCEAQVSRFNDIIKLDTGRKVRIEKAVNRIREFCASDEELRQRALGDVFLQGSVRTGTVIKPVGNEDFDVDVVFPFRASEAADPAQTINWFISRLRRSEFYRNNLEAKDRCARINYAGDFHIDIIPATQSMSSLQPYAVPAKDLRSWVTNDPVGFAEWVQRVDARSMSSDADGVGRFIRSCRMMKRWRDHLPPARTAPSSILLVTMLGKHDPSLKEYSPPIENALFPDYQTDLAYLYDMLRLTHSCLTAARRSALTHPTIPDEDLSRGWGEPEIQDFLTSLGACVESIRLAIYAESDAVSLPHLRRVFGDSFPAT